MGPSGSSASSTFHPPPRGNEELFFGIQRQDYYYDYYIPMNYELV